VQKLHQKLNFSQYKINNNITQIGRINVFVFDRMKNISKLIFNGNEKPNKLLILHYLNLVLFLTKVFRNCQLPQ